MRYKLFVYGTLKKGLCNHSFLQNARYLGEAVTKDSYPLIAPKKWYPYLIDEPGRGKRVKGELYLVDLPTLKRIDRLEEYPRYYTRKRIKVFAGGQEHEALAYFFASKIPYWRFAMLEEFPPKKE